ncbi:hypothetical protein LCGC14_0754400 [marine sediment metagenome]|uniref:Uncharacterized protein n=1 Tax=marine sediment metagenome TaxID=412755 RepID=A0A0F9Q353_9ZZZZ
MATTGVFEFDCASSTFELGDLLGPDDNSAQDALVNQQAITVTNAARAVGRCAKRAESAVLVVLVDIKSTIMYGGPQEGIAST